jgi:squalene-hopene/tetraprenyl-beta-curcumene cyclase
MFANYLGRTLLLGILVLFLTVTRVNAGGPTTWNKELAAKYLDERAKVWFENFPTADRGQGPSKTSCVSCHSVAPYALARPVLRKLMGKKEATKYEDRLLAQITQRVASWKELDSPQFQLFYDFNERKKKESWGTEAVLNCFLLACDDAFRGRTEPSVAARTAFSNLWKTQAMVEDQAGSWDWLDFHLEPWESKQARYFGATLAAIALGTAPGYYHAGVDPELDKHVNQLRTYLRTNFAKQNLYNRVWLLWAATKVQGVLSPEEQKNIIAEIQSRQQADGGWRLASLGAYKRNDATPQETESDGYATGLILHILQTVGLTKNEPTVRKGLAWLRRNQRRSGAWVGYSVNKKRAPESTNEAKAHVGKFLWDAATAYAVLALSDAE